MVLKSMVQQILIVNAIKYHTHQQPNNFQQLLALNTNSLIKTPDSRSSVDLDLLT